MTFYSVLKYVLMVLFMIIIAFAVANQEDEKASNAITQHPQSKFNL